MTGRFLLAVGLLLTTALAMAWGSGAPAQATTFNPFFGPPDFYSLQPTGPGSHADVHAQFNILPPSANFSSHLGGLITFEDSDVNIAGAADIPGTGAYMGRLESVATLGIGNEGCNSELSITFNLIEAEVAVTARPITNPVGGVAVGGAIAVAADNTTTDMTYTTAGGVDPLGIKAGADVAGLGTAPEGTVLAGVNEIQIDSEQMLVVGIDAGAPGTGGTWRVIRGWNGTTPAVHAPGATISRMSVIYPNGPGTNLLANLGEDDGDLDNNGTVENPEYVNGIPDGADAVPSFVRNSLDPNTNANDGGYVQAHARYMGVAYVANSLIVILQFVIMAPNALTLFPNLHWATTAWGYGTVTFLQDPLAPPSDSAITDFCNFKSNTLLYGVTHDNACTGASPPVACSAPGAGFTLRLAVDGGCPGLTTPNECGSFRLTLPATPQRLRAYQYAVSQRDYDDDGIANGLDPCPYTPTPGWDPYANNAVSGDDSDADGLPDECDPNPNVPNPDADCDGDPNPAPPCNSTGWDNRADNCPTTPNTAPVMAQPNQNQFDRDVPFGVDVPDGGPPSDDIGPECDIAGNSCAGCVGTLTPTGANGHYHATYTAQTICIGPPTSDCSDTADDDQDGVVNAHDTCIGNAPSGDGGPNGANPPLGYSGPHGQDTTTAAASAGDSGIVVSSSEGFTTGSPIMIGGSPGPGPRETLRYITAITPTIISFSPALTHNHPSGTDVRQVAFAQSARDVNNDGFSDISDIAQVSGAFGSQGGDPGNDGVGDSAPPGYEGRLDITYDRYLDISDISAMSGVFGARCGPS